MENAFREGTIIYIMQINSEFPDCGYMKKLEHLSPMLTLLD